MSWLAAAGHHVGTFLPAGAPVHRQGQPQVGPGSSPDVGPEPPGEGARRHAGLACELLNREVFTPVLQPELGVLSDLGDLGEGIRADDARGEPGWSAPGRRRAGEAPPFDG
jgi:hypothetical protein